MADASDPNNPQSDLKDPVAQQGSTSKPDNEPTSRVGAGVGLPNAQINNRSSSEAEELRRQRWKAVREWGPIVISLAAFGVSFGSCYGSNRSADIAERALTSVQRAYVSFQKLSPVMQVADPDSKKVVAVQLSAIWTNDGATPARASIWWQREQRQTPLPKNFTFVNTTNRDDRRVAAIGPKATASTTGLYVPMEVLEQVRQKKAYLYFWGAAVYRDVFKDTPTHLTEFCVEVTNLVPLISPVETWSAEVVSCQEHNCYDRECPDYQAQVDEAVAQFPQLKENPQ